MIKVGITGGIGSGKSLICQVFEVLKVPVYYADEEAKKLTETDVDIRKDLTALFGDPLYATGTIDRVYMADRIFNNKPLLEKVNNIIHPRVAQHFTDWCNKYFEHPYILHESAIIFEIKSQENFDRIIAVSSPEHMRFARVMARQNMNPGKFQAIKANQLPEAEKTNHADFIINNDGTELLIPQILKIHHILTT